MKASNRAAPRLVSDRRVGWVEILTVAASLAALIVSWLSALYVRKQHTDTEGAELIRSTYGEFLNLSGLQVNNPDVAHLFALPDGYSGVKALVQQSCADATISERAELFLRERALAEALFTMYEHAFYQWSHAQEVGDVARAEFLREVLDYYTGRLLRNPRLLWYWSDRGGKLREHFEAKTIAYYDSMVLANPASPISFDADPTGPYELQNLSAANPEPAADG